MLHEPVCGRPRLAAPASALDEAPAFSASGEGPASKERTARSSGPSGRHCGSWHDVSVIISASSLSLATAALRGGGLVCSQGLLGHIHSPAGGEIMGRWLRALWSRPKSCDLSSTLTLALVLRLADKEEKMYQLSLFDKSPGGQTLTVADKCL